MIPQTKCFVNSFFAFCKKYALLNLFVPSCGQFSQTEKVVCKKTDLHAEQKRPFSRLKYKSTLPQICFFLKNFRKVPKISNMLNKTY